MQSIEIRTTQNVSIEYELASLRDRILAFLVDALILTSIFSMIVFTLLMLLASAIGDSTGGVFGSLLPFLALIGYYFFSELFMDGQTLGKKALNIKVVRIDGKQPSVSDYLLRAIFQVIDTVFSFGVLAALMISTSHKRQRLGDMTANTTVIRTRTNTEFRLWCGYV